MYKPEPIDAVVTWVDGSDPDHQEKLNSYLKLKGFKPKAAEPVRFSSDGEIDFCVASLLRYAKFIRTIHIVTDNQTPELVHRYLKTEYEKKINLVDHKEIFLGFEQSLPTFSSLSIETMLYKIPGLADKFIYLNDDFFLLEPVTPSDFFVNGKPVLRGKYIKRQEYRRRKRFRNWLGKQKDPYSPSFRRSQELSAIKMWASKYCWGSGHVPHPLLKITFQEIFAANPEWQASNISHKLRHVNQFSPIALANHYEIMRDNAVTIINKQDFTVDPMSMTVRKLRKILERNDSRFLCVQNFSEATEDRKQIVMDFLKKRIEI